MKPSTSMDGRSALLGRKVQCQHFAKTVAMSDDNDSLGDAPPMHDDIGIDFDEPLLTLAQQVRCMPCRQ